MNFKNLCKIIDASHLDRVKALVEKFGDNPKHYLSQLSRVKEPKLSERVKAWYDYLDPDYPNVLKALQETYPEILKGFKTNHMLQVEAEEREEERRREKQAKEEQRRVQKQEEDQKIQEALDGGPGFANFTYEPHQFMSAPDRFFYSLSKNKGIVVLRETGNASPGWQYSRHDGRIYPIATNYTVKNREDSVSFNVTCLSNEGFDPSNSTGWSESGDKKWYVGASFGWILNDGPKTSWKEVKSIIASTLKSHGLMD